MIFHFSGRKRKYRANTYQSLNASARTVFADKPELGLYGERFNKLIDILRTGILHALHNFSLVNEVLDGFIFVVSLYLVVDLVNIQNFDGDDLFRWNLATIGRI